MTLPHRTARELSEALRRAIAARDTLRQGTIAHRRASGDVRVLQQQLVEALAIEEAGSGAGRRTVGGG